MVLGGGRAVRQRACFSTILLETTPKMEKMGKPSAFYTDWGPGDYQCQGDGAKASFSSDSAILNRRYASFKFQERLYQIDLCPG